MFGDFEGRLEEVSCPICQPPPPPRLIFRTREHIGIWQCPGCRILYASPRFDEPSLLRIYENEAFMLDTSAYEHWSRESWAARNDRTWIVPNLKVQLVKRFLAPGDRVLDVGCATGEFCLAALSGGLKSEGIDVSEMLTDIARDVLKAPVRRIDVESFFPDYRFQGIVIWDVLEHVYDPVRTLRACHRLLEPGGYLFAQVPNSRGLSNALKSLACRAGVRNGDYRHFGFPYHVYSCNRTSLSALMHAAGFEAFHFESWPARLKDGRRGAFVDLLVSAARTYCLSDYIIVVARKT